MAGSSPAHFAPPAEALLRGLLESTPDPVFVKDLQGRHVPVNPAAARMLGQPAEAIIGHDDTLLFPELAAAIATLDREIIASGQARTFEESGVIGGVFRILLTTKSPFTDAAGNVIGLLGIARDITKDRRVEEELRTSNVRLAAAQAQAGLGYWDFDPATNRGFWSPELYRMWGRDPALGPPTLEEYLELVHPDDRALVMRMQDQAMVSREPIRVSVRSRPVAGQYRSFHATLYCLRDDAGQVVRIVGTSLEFTEEQRSVEALLTSEERFHAFMNNSPATAFLKDAAGRLLYANPAFIRAFAFEDVAWEGKTDLELWPPETARQLRANDETILTSGRALAIEEAVQQQDGIHHWLTIKFPFRDSPGRLYLAGMGVDLTERKRAEEALRERERFIERIAEANPSIMYVYDLIEQRVVYVNREIALTLGYSPEETQAMGPDFLGRLTHPEDAARLPALLRRWDTARDGDILDVEYRMRDARGNYRWFLGRDTIFQRTAEGRVKQIIGTATDITARKEVEAALQQSEERLRQAQKMEAVGRLAGGVAHDFNNLLTVINGYASLMIERRARDDVERGLLEQIAEAGERAAALTRQLLAFSRKQLVSFTVLNLNEVVASMQKMLSRLIGEDVRLTTRQAPGLRPVKADPGQMEQVILNLAINARDAMLDGGELTIQTMNVDLDAAAVHGQPDARPGPYVRLAVTDSGSGMDTATQAQIFEPFFTTKGAGKGTGLGLATVQGIVKQSGGHIVVHSAPGRGSTFDVLLPAVTEAPDPSAADCTPAPNPAGTEVVLVAEDDDTVRRLTCAILQRYGYRALAARAPAEALRLAAQDAQPIDLLLTDVVMPHMNGRQLAQQVLQLRPTIRVLYVSGYTDDEILRHGVLDEGVPFLNKPFAPEVLARKVREVLDR